MTDLDIGTTLSPSQQLSLLFHLEYVLDTEVEWQNQLIYLQTADVEADPMKEVRQLSSSLKGMMEGIRKAAADAQASFEAEAQKAMGNADKVKSVAGELKASNKELEEFLGESGSNFPPSETSSVASLEAGSGEAQTTPSGDSYGYRGKGRWT